MAEEITQKINVTLSIDRNVKLDFKIENARNSADMSATVEQFMKNYIKASKELNEERESKK